MQVSTTSELSTLGGRIKAVRMARGLKLAPTARHIGISRTSLSQWEGGGVKNPELEKLLAFAKLADVDLGWLATRKGRDPDLSRRKETKPARATSQESTKTNTDIPEIPAALSAHAEGFDMTASAIWSIPADVAELVFHGTPGKLAISRVISRMGSELGLARDDYLLIDTSRNRIDDPGVWVIADPEGKSARRAIVTKGTNGAQLKVMLMADDINRTDEVLVVDEETRVLGRVMAVMRPM